MYNTCMCKTCMYIRTCTCMYSLWYIAIRYVYTCIAIRYVCTYMYLCVTMVSRHYIYVCTCMYYS